jgi:ankyrin repeat protein
MKALIDAGADIHAKTADGRTALMLACYWGHAEAVRALLDKGAHVNDKDKSGYLAIDFARSNDHKEIISILEKASAKR